jgi:hypothetical protein
MSPFWLLEFSDVLWIFGKFLHPWDNLLRLHSICVGVVTTLHSGRPRNRGTIPAVGKYRTHLVRVQTARGLPKLCSGYRQLLPRGWNGRDSKATNTRPFVFAEIPTTEWICLAANRTCADVPSSSVHTSAFGLTLGRYAHVWIRLGFVCNLRCMSLKRRR